jgi:hypothetical protein
MEVKMLSLFGLDKLATQIIGGVIIVVLLIGGYFYWKHTIKAEALAEWNKAQVEQVQREQAKLIENLTIINKNQQDILKEIGIQRQALEKKFGDVDNYLEKDSTTKEYKGKSSSDVLKRTFKELNK